ncbi:MAG: hypothetical protein PVJ92_02720 [Candidatus Dependentiae bacterium]|jgi:hypothetical protein
MKYLQRLLSMLPLLAFSSSSLYAAATIQTVYHSIDKLQAPAHSSQRIHNQFGEKPRLPKNGIMCSFTVARAQPRKEVVLDFCVQEKKDLVTQWRITLGGQQDRGGSEPYKVYSSIEHLAPNTGSVIERHEVEHTAGTPLIKENHSFHLMFKLASNTLEVKVFEAGAKQPLLAKTFTEVPARTYYLVPASGNSAVTYQNVILRKLAP